MIFITEDDLRYKYRQNPFTTYEPEPNTRLTPGARQFLADRGIFLYDEEIKVQPVIKESLTKEVCCPTANPAHNGLDKPKKSGKTNWRMMLVLRKLDTVAAAFLNAEQVVLSEKDVLTAQSLTKLSKQFNDIRLMVNGKGTAPGIPCNGCSGMSSECFSEDQGDCFEITDFHVQLENGRVILALHQLRCELREIEPVVMLAFEGKDSAAVLCNDLIEKINQIINSLSQMICGAVGGKECQRTK